MWRFVISFCAVLAVVKGETTEVNQCTSHAGELPINVYIGGCGTPPCALPQLQDAVINIIFRAPYVMHDMRTLATAYLPTVLGAIPIPYNLGDNALTCNFLTNTYCPVVQGEVVQYVLRMYIESFFAVGTQANIEFRIVDDKNNSFICIRVPILIVAAVDGRLGAHNATVDVQI